MQNRTTTKRSHARQAALLRLATFVREKGIPGFDEIVSEYDLDEWDRDDIVDSAARALESYADRLAAAQQRVRRAAR